MKLFNKILIANRGEIAVRVIKSAQKLGIETVAIYSVADEESLHVELADEAYCLGDSIELSDTYLNIERIIEIAKRTESEAIHPGYGFLAENPAFVAACKQDNIIFIGPHTRAIKLMGNKIESREFVKKLGIPMTEAKTGDKASLMKAAKEIPFPLLVKAAAGGGGKGMRIVHSENELKDAIENTSREAKNYFSDGTVFVEKYVEEPRHIEIQVIGDNFGNVIHLFERECSIQRRYQKIIEESPSPTLTPEVRKKMGDAAVKISKEIEYNNAGTVEFLVDKDLNFYFLEMNTRVQVEHPVTEMVTGVDIVKEQILVAAGNKLSLKQEELAQNGHAIESRIYAEDPENNFLPSPGEMTFYHEPQGNRVRIDTGIEEATTIESFYDPMIAKLVVWSNDRESARKKMITALKNYIIHGIKTNIPYLEHLLGHNAYITNNITTKYCDEYTDYILEQIEKERSLVPQHYPVIAYSVYSIAKDYLNIEDDFSIWKQIGYWRDLTEFTVTFEDREIPVKFKNNNDGKFEFDIEGEKSVALFESLEYGIVKLSIDNTIRTFYISNDDKGNGFISYDGFTFQIRRNDILVQEDFFGSLDADGGNGQIVSPMPGKVIKINVNEGDKIKKGDVLLIVEAMKMENNIVSPRDAIVEKVNVAVGNMVDGSTELVILSQDE
jgi:acetyl-CoA carboxylase biotin carboxylase subunit